LLTHIKQVAALTHSTAWYGSRSEWRSGSEAVVFVGCRRDLGTYDGTSIELSRMLYAFLLLLVLLEFPGADGVGAVVGAIRISLSLMFVWVGIAAGAVGKCALCANRAFGTW